jgi:hypothetical protein
MQRRAFIQLSAFTAAALALPFANGCTGKKYDIESQPYLFSHLVDAKTIMETGLAYRKANPAENDKGKLIELLSAGNPSPIKPDENAFRAMLVQTVNNDFKTGKMAIVKGWVLSITEARQCALFSILQS